MIIRLEHVKAVGLCAAGARNFAKTNGFNWDHFLRHGIDSTKLEHIDNALVKQVLEKANEQR